MDFAVVVPALNITDESGRLDFPATCRYAERARESWVDLFLLNGSTTRGDLLSPAERSAVLDLWVDIVGPARLLACAWESADLEAATLRHVTPMAVMRGIRTPTAALDFLRGLPNGSTIYSHPMFGLPFGPELARRAADAGCIPAGGKLAKVTVPEIEEIHRCAPHFTLWDGSARHVRKSVEVGAAGIVATALAPLVADGLPSKDIDELQTVIDNEQAALDALPNRDARSTELLRKTDHLLTIVK